MQCHLLEAHPCFDPVVVEFAAAKCLTSLAGHEGRSQDLNGIMVEDKKTPQ
jgi:hypothetical protein